MILSPLSDEQKKGPRLIYSQKKGWIYPCCIVVLPFVYEMGYSGYRKGKDNPGMQNIHDVGPIPRGFWHIGPAHDDPHTGPITMDLIPYPGTETFGRDLFRIHGDSKSDPGNASHGCIILARDIREKIASSSIQLLEVV